MNSPQTQSCSIATIVLVVTGAFLLAGCGEEVVEAEPVIRPVKTITLGDTAGGSGRAFPGTVRAGERAKLSFRVAGPLVQLPADEGLEVRKGQLLAQIDPRDFQTAVNNLEAQLADLRAQRKAMNQARPEDIRRLEANLSAARASLLEATANFRRYQRLYENDNVSKAEFDRRRAAQEVAEAEVSSAEESLKVGRQGARVEDIEAMDARIRGLVATLKKAQDDLADTSLKAPYDGVVAERYIENFEYVQARTPVISLQNISFMELVAQIPETVVARYRDRDEAVQSAEFFATFPSHPDQRVVAKPTEFSTEADPVTRTYAVVFGVPQPPRGRILAGMTGEIHIQLPSGEGLGFSVPVAAVFTDETGKSCVWTLDKQTMTPKKVEVNAGEMAGESVLLEGGVKEGDTVITPGASFPTAAPTVRAPTTALS
ncbi:MAG: efflux RND transporter periplasmic adaptor subunit, partial [bacterium]|nr:efflux RND transporter periplasmic adaptor subunit [bacterium]